MHLTGCRDDVIGYCDDVIGCRNDVTGYYSDIIILPVYPIAILCHIKCTSHFIKHTLYIAPFTLALKPVSNRFSLNWFSQTTSIMWFI